MTVISANQPQDLHATQLKVQFFGVGARSSLGLFLSGEKIHLESADETAQLAKFMRLEGDSRSFILDLARASEFQSELIFFVESGSNESVSWSVESLHDSTNLQSEGVSLVPGETMQVLSFNFSNDDWQITSLEKRDSGGVQAQAPNSEIPSSIQDLEVMARGGSKKSQKFSNMTILLDMTISMKPHLSDSKLSQLISAIQAVGVASGVTSVTTNFGGMKSVESDITEELELVVGSTLADKNLWSASSMSMRRLMSETVSNEKRKSRFLVITDGFFLIDSNTVNEIDTKGHSVEILILGFDGVRVSMPSSQGIKAIELDTKAESGRDFLAQIAN